VVWKERYRGERRKGKKVRSARKKNQSPEKLEHLSKGTGNLSWHKKVERKKYEAQILLLRLSIRTSQHLYNTSTTLQHT
jgi:hypothetical protein